MAAAAAITDTAEGKPVREAGGKRKLLLIGVGVLLLAGGGGGAWFAGLIPHGGHKEEAHAEAKASAAPVFFDLPDIVAACLDGGASGLVICNTTLARPAGLRGHHASEAGGLSGAPLLAVSTAMLARVARLARGRLLLVGAGGVASGADVLAKLRAGASFVQLYTAFALHGPALLPRLRRELIAALDAHGHADVAAAVGAGL